MYVYLALYPGLPVVCYEEFIHTLKNKLWEGLEVIIILLCRVKVSDILQYCKYVPVEDPGIAKLASLCDSCQLHFV